MAENKTEGDGHEFRGWTGVALVAAVASSWSLAVFWLMGVIEFGRRFGEPRFEVTPMVGAGVVLVVGLLTTWLMVSEE